MNNRNIKLLMLANNVNEEEFADVLNMTLKAVKNRLSGVTDFSKNEMLVIKKEIFPEYTIDQIFDDSIEIFKLKS